MLRIQRGGPLLRAGRAAGRHNGSGRVCGLGLKGDGFAAALGLMLTNFIPEDAVEGGKLFMGVDLARAFGPPLGDGEGEGQGLGDVAGRGAARRFRVPWLPQEKRELVVALVLLPVRVRTMRGAIGTHIMRERRGAARPQRRSAWR